MFRNSLKSKWNRRSRNSRKRNTAVLMTPIPMITIPAIWSSKKARNFLISHFVTVLMNPAFHSFCCLAKIIEITGRTRDDLNTSQVLIRYLTEENLTLLTGLKETFKPKRQRMAQISRKTNVNNKWLI